MTAFGISFYLTKIMGKHSKALRNHGEFPRNEQKLGDSKGVMNKVPIEEGDKTLVKYRNDNKIVKIG